MTRLWHWVLFEVLGSAVSAGGAIGCIFACKQIFSHLSSTEPVLFVLGGTGGLLVAALGAGFVLAIILFVLMAKDINPEVAREEAELRNRNL